MDRELRELERRAREGDLQAATRWFMMLSRARPDDYESVLEAMRLMGELQYPGLFEMLKQLEEIQRLIAPPPVEDGEWTTEIWISDNTSGDATNQRHDLQNSYGSLRIAQVSGANPDVFINMGEHVP